MDFPNKNDGMIKPVIYCLSSILFLVCLQGTFPETVNSSPVYPSIAQKIPSDKQLLLNGRIWYNEYSKAFGDQFFLSNTFLKGSVTFNGRKYNNLDLLYDIANDELILSFETYPVIIMNKEMVDSFSLVFHNKVYNFNNYGTDTCDVLKGYVHVLYSGTSALYVKYDKKLQLLAVDGRYDLFYQEHNIYLSTDDEIILMPGRKKFLRLLEDKQKEIRSYLNKSRLKLIRKNPETFIPVIKYYDSLKNEILHK